MNIFSFLGGKHLGMEFQGSIVSTCVTSEETTQLFFTEVADISTHQKYPRAPSVPFPHQHLVLSAFKY